MDVKEARDRAAAEWIKTMQKRDPEIRQKVAAYLRDGSYEAEMPTRLIAAQEAMKE